MAENLYHHEFNQFYEWGTYGANIVAAESAWKRPLRWDCEATGERRRVFCLADLFEDCPGPMINAKGEQLWIDTRNPPTWFSGNETEANQLSRQADVRPLTMQDVRARLFRLIDATPHLDWMLLTKRPENIAGMMPDFVLNHNSDGQGHDETSIRPNLWLGTSVENKATRSRIDELCKVPAAVRFLSCEPLLEDLDLQLGKSEGLPTNDEPCRERANLLSLVIAGGESGPYARPCNIAWIRSLRDQCKAAGVAFFLKQVGSRPLITYSELCELKPNAPAVDCSPRTLDVLPLKDPKGGNPLEWPEDMRVREMP